MSVKKVTTILMNKDTMKKLKMFALENELPLSEAIEKLLEENKKLKEVK